MHILHLYHVSINLISLDLAIIQAYSDHEELLQNLKDGTSEECCFANHDITTENVIFETDGDPLAAARHIFVS